MNYEIYFVQKRMLDTLATVVKERVDFNSMKICKNVTFVPDINNFVPDINK